ncbi:MULTISPECIES: hypothetical protein [unclassified Myroides]|uniref:hypothetical protein n=1 Tax=unclassified Myroides TaxID=2642485 RepID=UPI003D2F9161
MMKYNRHIAQFLCLLFVLLGAEKVNFFTQQDCESKVSFCPIATMYVYQLGNSSADHAEKTTKSKSCKATNISCETFFIAQTAEQAQTTKRLYLSHKQYFYQPVIHSNPYITLVDPPPNIEQV